jgi:hypothetical protein
MRRQKVIICKFGCGEFAPLRQLDKAVQTPRQPSPSSERFPASPSAVRPLFLR